jgi:23S rRNA (guanosine2251-2'-O)-methyltransferase
MTKQNLNTIFGTHAVHSVLTNAPERVKQVFTIRGKATGRLAEVIQLAKQAGCSINTIDKQTFEKQFGLKGQTHQGIAADLKPMPTLNENDLKQIVENAKNGLRFLVLDGVTDPHNVGACLRSADAFGMSAVIVPKDKSSGLTPTACKVACGAAETMPFIQVTNLARTLQYLQQEGVWIYGAAGETDTSLYDLDLAGNIALVLGAEGGGLRRLTRETCDGLFAIPMVGSVESLNVSVAAGISLSYLSHKNSDSGAV